MNVLHEVLKWLVLGGVLAIGFILMGFLLQSFTRLLNYILERIKK
jgi:hypothetical protein